MSQALTTWRRPIGLAVAIVACVLSPSVVTAAQGELALSAAQIDEALRLVADEKAVQTFLGAYVLQTKTGLGAGPMVGWISTPFSRVVLAAAASRKTGTPLTRDDVPEDLLSPELLVITRLQPAAQDDSPLAKPDEIAIARRIGTQLTDVLLPLRTRSATVQERRLYELDTAGPVVVAMFSLDALAPIFDTRELNLVVRVRFDRLVKGSSPVTACKDCVVPISPRIR